MNDELFVCVCVCANTSTCTHILMYTFAKKYQTICEKYLESFSNTKYFFYLFFFITTGNNLQLVNEF